MGFVRKRFVLPILYSVTKLSASKFLDVKWIRVSNYNTKPLSTQIRMFTIQISIVLSEDVELSCLVDFSSPYSATYN